MEFVFNGELIKGGLIAEQIDRHAYIKENTHMHMYGFVNVILIDGESIDVK